MDESDNDKYPILWSTRYAMRFGRRQSKLLDRLSSVIKVTTFLTGTTAFFSAFDGDPIIVKWSALITGLLAIIDVVWNPSGLAAKSREMEMKYAALNRDAPQMTAADLQRAFDDLHNADVTEIDALRPAAYNDTVAEFGNESSDGFSLTWWQRLVSALA